MWTAICSAPLIPALVGRGEGASDAVVVVLESLDDALREKCLFMWDYCDVPQGRNSESWTY
jgi:hypothetical protein